MNLKMDRVPISSCFCMWGYYYFQKGRSLGPSFLLESRGSEDPELLTLSSWANGQIASWTRGELINFCFLSSHGEMDLYIGIPQRLLSGLATVPTCKSHYLGEPAARVDPLIHLCLTDVFKKYV